MTDQYNTEIDSGLVDKIVCEVKSQGLFDQFRRECLADVDTKPAYQNLQQRVESSVAAFLSNQIWTPELNKNQLREKLRKNITGKGFLDTGVERIVDQVVNPKLSSNFVPKIEDVAYKYMGVEKPMNRLSELEIDTSNQQQFLPNLDLEQVSPDSEKCPSVEPHSPNGHIANITNDDRGDDAEDKMDDLESPAFEPIQCKIVKNEILAQDDDKDDDKMDICLGDSDDDLNKSNGFNVDEVKSNLSSISGLTSNESIEEEQSKNEYEAIKIEKTDHTNTEKSPLLRSTPPETTIQQFDAIEQPEEKPSIHYTNDVVENLNQDSVLSQVSSNSRLSIITNNNTNTRMDDEDDHGNPREGLIRCVGNGGNIEKESTCPYGISEEAQMQRFNDSSSSNNSLVIDTDNVSSGTNQCDKRDEFATVFDINREEIKFEGTERKSFDIDLSEPIVVVDGKEVLHVSQSESNTSGKDVAKTLDTVVASSTDTSKDVYFKSEDLSSVSIVDVNDTSARIISPKIENTPDDAKLRTEDSKGLDESSSMSSKHKDCKSSSSTSSSSHRNGIEAHSKPKPKDRHGSSSSSKHRSHSDRNKRSHSSSHSSKDKTKNSHGDVDEKHRESSKHRSDERISKNHRKSSSSTSKTGNDVSRTSSSKNHKDKERSRSGKKDSHRHSSSSLPASTSHDKDFTPKQDSKNADIKASRSDSHRSGHREKDDHTSHKIKAMPRRRSRSKDSNDGSGNPSNGLRNAPNYSISTIQSTSNPAQESGTDQQISSEQQTMLMDLNAVSATEKASSTSNAATISVDAAENDFVFATQPVVVDQMLSGNELNLESFIDENRDNPIFSSIERTLADHAKIKKPKIAANVYEARKLMKVRKQIDRDEQKKLEKARVLAKKYVRSNLTTIVDDNQGVELEFACMGSSADAPGPSISSPVKLSSSKEKVCDEKAIQSLASSLRGKEDAISNVNQSESSLDDVSLDFDSTEFEGFSTHVSDAANVILRQFEIVFQTATTDMMSTQTKSKTQPKRPSNKSTHTATSKLIPSDQFIEMMSSNEDNRQLFLENNKIDESDSSAITKPLNIRKRKYTGTSSAETSTKGSTDEGEMASVVANVYITPKAGSSSGRPDASTLDKQRQKTRYSNEDLFKPRPVLASRTRRRGINCSD